jgi:hypothetical protein
MWMFMNAECRTSKEEVDSCDAGMITIAYDTLAFSDSWLLNNAVNMEIM